MIVLLTLMNLRGVRESGKLFAIPTYVFVAGVFLMFLWGAFRGIVLGDTMRAPTADYHIKAEHSGLAGAALVFLLLRAFSSGCAALTGVEAISNGVPAFRKPKTQERRDHPDDDGPVRGHHVLRDHRAGHDHQSADGREPAPRTCSTTASRSAPATSRTR